MPMTGDTVYIVSAVLGTAGLLLGGLVKWVVLPLWRLTRKAGHFFDAWNGEPARDGLPARPGVVDRIVATEYQLHSNGGGSMKDAVDRIEAKVDGQAALAVEVKSTLEARQSAVEHAVDEQAATVREALDLQAAEVRAALESHTTVVDAEFLKVWRELATRDIHKSADQLNEAADRAERAQGDAP